MDLYPIHHKFVNWTESKSYGRICEIEKHHIAIIQINKLLISPLGTNKHLEKKLKKKLGLLKKKVSFKFVLCCYRRKLMDVKHLEHQLHHVLLLFCLNSACCIDSWWENMKRRCFGDAAAQWEPAAALRLILGEMWQHSSPSLEAAIRVKGSVVEAELPVVGENIQIFSSCCWPLYSCGLAVGILTSHSAFSRTWLESEKTRETERDCCSLDIFNTYLWIV